MIGDENLIYSIRTVRVNRKKTETDQHFEEIMGTCGEFEPQIFTYQEDGKHVSFVTFKSTRGARNALKLKLCSSVDEWLEPKFIGHHVRCKWPSIEPVCEVDYISGLNDKCLIDIFSYFDMNDLLNLRRVNKLFNRIVTNFMIGTTDVSLFVKKNLENVDNFLKSFGRFTTKLKLHSYGDVRCSEEVLLLIPKYCLNDNLKYLDLTQMSTNDFPIEAYRQSKIFSELRVLKILVSDNKSLMEDIVKLCSSLKTLHVRSADINTEMSGSFLIHLPVNIERVTIGKFVEDEFFHLFIERSLRLQKLSCYIRTSAIIAKIVERQPQLKKLEIQRLGYDMPDFSIDTYALTIKNLKQLNSFELQYPWTMDVEMINVVSKIDSLEVLIINTERDGDEVFLPAIKRMKNLKNFQLSAYPSHTDTSKIWKQFLATLADTNPNLEDLYIDSFLPFEYYLPVISGHPTLRKLVVTPMFLDEDYSVPELFGMESFRKSVNWRARGTQNFPIILEVEMDMELRHFSKITSKYDHLVRIVDK